MIIVDMFFIKNCTTVWNYTLKSPWLNSSHFDEKQKQNFKKSIYITISKRFKTVGKQVKSNSSVQLFLEVYYYQRISSHAYTRNIAYGNKIFTFSKLNKFDQFYKKKNCSRLSSIDFWALVSFTKFLVLLTRNI